MFAIPFIFAWYPELLLIPEAVRIADASGARVLIEGHGGAVDPLALGLLSLRLILALYLVSSALARFDRGPMPRWEILCRLIVSMLILSKTAPVVWSGIGLGIALVVLHHVLSRRVRDPARA